VRGRIPGVELCLAITRRYGFLELDDSGGTFSSTTLELDIGLLFGVIDARDSKLDIGSGCSFVWIWPLNVEAQEGRP
jgi:hypothetical protein